MAARAEQLALDLVHRTNRMVILACTASKLDRPACAGRLYTGVIWSTWRKHGPPAGSMPIGWSVWVLSAEHGLLEGSRRVEPYNTRLTPSAVPALADRIAGSWRGQVARCHWRTPNALVEAVVIGGELYQRLAVQAGLPVVAAIDGCVGGDGRGGIGVLRTRVQHFAARVRSQMNVWPGDAAAAWPVRTETREAARAAGGER